MKRQREKYYFNWMEVHLADHCNLRCRSCSHHSPYLPEAFYPLDEFERDIQTFSKVAKLNLLKFVGGEPLLNKDIVSYLHTARRAKVARILCVVTNGILLHRMNDEFFGAVDRIEVSSYPALERLAGPVRRLLNEKARKFGFTFEIIATDRFYDIETDYPLSERDTEFTYAHCERRKHGPLIDRGYFYKCFRPATTLSYLRNRGALTDLPDFAQVDGIALHASSLRQRMADYMQSNNPLQCCRFCRLGFKREHSANWYEAIRDVLPWQHKIRLLLYRHKRVLSQYFRLRQAFGLTETKAHRADGVAFHPHELMGPQECKPRPRAPELAAIQE